MTISNMVEDSKIEKKKILVLGHKGMLGHMVVLYLSKFHEIVTVESRYPDSKFIDKVSKFDGDYIVNCIGSIPQKSNNFSVNTELPMWLEINSVSKIIHPSTDCESDDDEYGLSKRKATEYIVNWSKKTKIIQCSIIGPELQDHKSFFDWFLMNSSDSVQGYAKAIWNGVTTLEWSKICGKMINDWSSFKQVNVIDGERLSKLDLMNILSQEFRKDIEIIPNYEFGKDKSLSGEIKCSPIRTQIKELIEFYYHNQS